MGVHRGGDEKTPGWGPGLYRNGAVVSCHICNAAMVPVVDFGPMPLANGWHDPDRREPLALVYCQTCHLYQISHILPPDVLFADYSYRAGTAGMQRAMFAELASVIQVRLNLGGDDRVIDIGGNDGSFLDEFQEITRQLINCDPYAPRGTFHAVRKPWNLSTAKGFPEHRGRTLLTATNAWPHLPNQHDAMAGVAHALQRGGTLIVQMPWHRDLFNYHLYDTIYHEHLHYYGVAAFQRLCGDAHDRS